MEAVAIDRLDEYQSRARETDHLGDDAASGDPRLGPLLGLAGEVGTLLAGYKKWMRDGAAYELFEDNVREELGDILWSLSNAADKWGMPLSEIAAANLEKTHDRWPPRDSKRRRRPASDHLDAPFPRGEQLPRTFEVTIRPVPSTAGVEPKIEILWKGQRRANELGDNTYGDTGYRFHDVFHLANAAVLGWSPVARAKIFERKRRSDEMVNTVEDGGRAIVIEEGIAAYMFAYASTHDFLRTLERLDFSALKTFRTLSAGLEVDQRPLWQVEEAVIQGFRVWDKVQENEGGILRGDLAARTLSYVGTA